MKDSFLILLIMDGRGIFGLFYLIFSRYTPG